MITVCLDTSFLMSLFDRNGPGHDNAVRYLREWIDSPDVRIVLPTVALAEYSVKATLPLDLFGENLFLCSFGERDAYIAARLYRQWMDTRDKAPAADNSRGRVGVKDDFKIIATALVQHADILATEDGRTMARYAEIAQMLPDLGATPQILLTTDPYSRELALGDPQMGLGL